MNDARRAGGHLPLGCSCVREPHGARLPLAPAVPSPAPSLLQPQAVQPWMKSPSSRHPFAAQTSEPRLLPSILESSDPENSYSQAQT